MMISEIKRWAKSLGYEVKNSKEDSKYKWKHEEEAEYHFSKDVDLLATDIFNHHTENKWKPYQEEYVKKSQILA